MDTKNLAKISDDLFNLLLRLNAKTFNKDEMVKGLPMPPSHVKVIFSLAHFGSLPISKVAEHLCISKSNMTPIIDKLIREDLVVRYEDPNDRRVLLVELTPKAIEVFEAEKQKIKDVLLLKISTLNDEDLKILDQSVFNLSNIIKKLK
ncbi:MarR family winged helix-turn-helix transcriptional regulator [Clostridium sp.]|uniref:MarR family winged helix-turn-helix transcriptional regulator n=1 Tax=Clostridium sp. TaxID=1506 RepID=UPI003F33595B